MHSEKYLVPDVAAIAPDVGRAGIRPRTLPPVPGGPAQARPAAAGPV